MLVKELIELLSTYDKNLEVVVEYTDLRDQADWKEPSLEPHPAHNRIVIS